MCKSTRNSEHVKYSVNAEAQRNAEVRRGRLTANIRKYLNLCIDLSQTALRGCRLLSWRIWNKHPSKSWRAGQTIESAIQPQRRYGHRDSDRYLLCVHLVSAVITLILCGNRVLALRFSRLPLVAWLGVFSALMSFRATAQSAEDFFHRGAQFYIWNQKQKATNEIFTGLRLYPADPQLNQLAALLKKEEEQEKQQQQQQQQQNQQNDQSKQEQNQQQQQQAQQNQSEQKQDSSQQDQQKKPDQSQQQRAQEQARQEKQNPPPTPQDQQQTNQATSADQKKNSEDKEQQPAEAAAAGQMTPEQAKQLLDAEKGNEMMLPMKPENKPVDRSKPFRDW